MAVRKGRRYDTSGMVETQFEPGSRGRVLKNLLGIKKKREMDQVEAKALKRTVNLLIRSYDKDHRFTSLDVCKIHKDWLGGIYEWAGKYRQVNLSIGGFPFATATHLSTLMTTFEKGPLRQHTPCRFSDRGRVIKGLAEVHAELILIHPFREGNGRMARILATLMATQAGLPLLNFQTIEGNNRQEYFAAVRAGMNRNYNLMEKVFRKILRQSLSAS